MGPMPGMVDGMDQDEELAKLRAIYRERMGRMGQMQQGQGDVVPRLVGGGLDALSAGLQGQAAADSIAYRQPVRAIPTGDASQEIDRAIASRREKALGDVQMFKSLEDLARRKREFQLGMEQKEKDRASRDLFYRAQLGDKEAQRQFLEAIAGKRIGAEGERFDKKLSFEQEQKEKEREFRAAENEKNRAAAAAREASKAKSGGRGAGGKGGGKLLSTSSATDAGTAQAALSALDDVISESKKNQSISGPVMGRLAGLMGSMEIGETGRAAAALDSTLRQRAQVIGRYLEGGKLAEGDIGRYVAMLPQLSDSQQLKEAKAAGLKRLIAQKQQSELDALGGAGYNVSGIKRVQVPEFSGGEQTRMINGAKYKKVKGGWQKIK